MLNKERVLERTNNGLDVFRHYISGEWRVGRNFLNPLYEDKENELNELKTELAAVDRKIQLSLAPVDTSEDKKEDLQKKRIELLTKGKTSVINGFKSKGGKVFPAALKFDVEWKVVFDFPAKKGKK